MVLVQVLAQFVRGHQRAKAEFLAEAAQLRGGALRRGRARTTGKGVTPWAKPQKELAPDSDSSAAP